MIQKKVVSVGITRKYNDQLALLDFWKQTAKEDYVDKIILSPLPCSTCCSAGAFFSQQSGGVAKGVHSLGTMPWEGDVKSCRMLWGKWGM